MGPHTTARVPWRGCRMLSTAVGCIPAERTGFTQQPELKAACSLQLQHSKSKPDTEHRSKAVVLFFPATAAGRGFTPHLSPAPIPRSSAPVWLWEHEWCWCCCRSNAHNSRGHNPTYKHTESPHCCKVRIFYFTWPISLFPLEALHFLGRVRKSFVPLEEERRPNEFKVMTVIKKKISLLRKGTISSNCWKLDQGKFKLEMRYGIFVMMLIHPWNTLLRIVVALWEL